MKVLDLQCDAGHGFEGWFGSEADYVAQGERGLVECPLCASRAVHRLPSAPRLNLGAAQAEPARPGTPDTPEQQSVEALWLRAVRHVMATTEDVGERFPQEARRIHYGETAKRGIRGRITAETAEALRDEGIDVMPLPMPAAAKEPLQ